MKKKTISQNDVPFKIADRVKGTSGLSVGTHMIIEALFPNKYEKFDDKLELKPINKENYNMIVINILSIARNILSSIPDVLREQILKEKDFSYTILEELNILLDIFKEEKINILLWYPEYTKVIKNYTINKDVNKNLIMYLYYKWFKTAIDNNIKSDIKNIALITDHKLRIDIYNKFLLISNYTTDLLNSKKVNLLESYTGNVKTEKDFYTKYHSVGKLDLSNIPMNELCLYILGDYTLSPILPYNIRAELIKLSIDYNWTYRTTIDKIKHDMKKSDKLIQFINCIKLLY